MVYTEQMRDAIRLVKPPHGFSISIVDYETFLGIQFYESEWRHLSDKERYACLTYISKVKSILQSYGVSVTLDPILDIKYNDTREL